MSLSPFFFSLLLSVFLLHLPSQARVPPPQEASHAKKSNTTTEEKPAEDEAEKQAAPAKDATPGQVGKGIDQFKNLKALEEMKFGFSLLVKMADFDHDGKMSPKELGSAIDLLEGSSKLTKAMIKADQNAASMASLMKLKMVNLSIGAIVAGIGAYKLNGENTADAANRTVPFAGNVLDANAVYMLVKNQFRIFAAIMDEDSDGNVSMEEVDDLFDVLEEKMEYTRPRRSKRSFWDDLENIVSSTNAGAFGGTIGRIFGGPGGGALGGAGASLAAKLTKIRIRNLKSLFDGSKFEEIKGNSDWEKMGKGFACFGTQLLWCP